MSAMFPITWKRLQWQRDTFLDLDAMGRAMLVQQWRLKRDRALAFSNIARKQNDEPAAQEHRRAADLWEQMLAWAAEQSGAQPDMSGRSA